MKAIVFTEYGSPDVLHFEEVETPTPNDDQVLVKIHASSINAGDWHILRADPFLVRLAFGLRKPNIAILGADIAGRVEAVGGNVRQFKPGDEVFGDISGCGFGGFAEFVCVPETALAPKPDGLSFEQAAAVPAAGVTALQSLRDTGKIQPGQNVLINGASGGVGTFAIQLAKHFGAEVTGVCSTRNIEKVRALGADHVIDYTQEDFTTNGKQYDLIHAANGHQSIWAYKRSLSPHGRYVMSGGAMAQMWEAMLLGPFVSMFSGKSMGNMLVKPNQDDLMMLKALLEAGDVLPVIDRRFTLGDVPDAIRYMEDAHAQGKIVIAMDHADVN